EFHIDSKEGSSQLVYRLHEFKQNIGEAYQEFLLVKYIHKSSLQERPSIELNLNVDAKKWTVTAFRYLNFSDYDSQFLLENLLKNLWQKVSSTTPPLDCFSRTVEFVNVSKVVFSNLLPVFFNIAEDEIIECVSNEYVDQIG